MMRLDQAFIKVYGEQDGPLLAAAGCLRPEGDGDPSSGQAADPDTGGKSGESAVPADVETERAVAAGDGDECGAEHEGHGPPEAVHRLDRPAGCGPKVWLAEGYAVPSPHVRLPAGEGPRLAERAADPGPAEGQVGGRQREVESFLPMLQVDCFEWPPASQELGRVAAEQVDRLAEALIAATGRGKRVVAVGGCRRGEGATTVLLAAARRLAQMGLKVVMVDAHLADPQLAARLGLVTESGWEDVLSGRLPLEEVVVESAGDRLAILPACRVYAGSDGDGREETRLIEGIRTLAAHYDLVLLDPGPLEELGALGAELARGIGERLDAIALVHHRRLTPREDLDEVRRCLAATEIAQLGVIENFACE